MVAVHVSRVSYQVTVSWDRTVQVVPELGLVTFGSQTVRGWCRWCIDELLCGAGKLTTTGSMAAIAKTATKPEEHRLEEVESIAGDENVKGR